MKNENVRLIPSSEMRRGSNIEMPRGIKMKYFRESPDRMYWLGRWQSEDKSMGENKWRVYKIDIIKNSDVWEAEIKWSSKGEDAIIAVITCSSLNRLNLLSLACLKKYLKKRVFLNKYVRRDGKERLVPERIDNIIEDLRRCGMAELADRIDAAHNWWRYL